MENKMEYQGETREYKTTKEELCCCDNPNAFKEMEEARTNCSVCKKPY